MRNLKTFESYGKEDDEMTALIARSSKFEQEMKLRKRSKPSKIGLGDTVCIGKINKARGTRTYDLFDGKYYKCVEVNPKVVLEEERSSKRRVLTEPEYEKAYNNIKGSDYYWMIEE